MGSMAHHLKAQLIAVGKLVTAVMNLPKCRGPAQRLVVLGHLYDAVARFVKLPPTKQQKYLGKLKLILAMRSIPSKELESLLGYLSYASWTEP